MCYAYRIYACPFYVNLNGKYYLGCLYCICIHTFLFQKSYLNCIFANVSTFNNTGVSKYVNTTSTTNYFVQFVLCPNLTFLLLIVTPFIVTSIDNYLSIIGLQQLQTNFLIFFPHILF